MAVYVIMIWVSFVHQFDDAWLIFNSVPGAGKYTSRLCSRCTVHCLQPGSYTNVSTQVECKQCKLGKYVSTGQATACNNCDADTYSAARGATAYTLCTKQGYFS